jgi:glycosyltransferase involved in cell wall biosynthesis
MKAASRNARIGFVGSMNAMPMTYALKFRRDGHDVRYVVEAPRDNFLMRPEHQFAGRVPYPYPDWIAEIPWPNDLLHHATLPWSNREAVREMADRDIVVLNDYGLALAPWMPPGCRIVALSSGADIDVHCRPEMAHAFASAVRRRWLYPARLALELWRTRLQRRGLASCDIVCYFPRGLNPAGDEVIDELIRRRPEVLRVERYDVDFEAAGVRRLPVVRRALQKILVPVRVNLRPPIGGSFEYKGNDLILRALSRYRERQPSLEIHLFDKGPAADLAIARQLCRELGLSDCVTWHQPMPLPKLLELYADCDVCFDQVGNHWMGAIGCYALYMGRPLIANARLDVFGHLWGADPPILQAASVDEIHQQLVRCEDLAFRETLAERGHRFAAEKLDAEAVYLQLRRALLGKAAE